ncbi:MAG TPA: hypothetical protein DCZ94_12215 [Lentisphaeria bacterium]|nr:MAG: hypothetical protein A2X48_12650 [Lentisphaerae bacterium GWF2_49_21]HBC87714.1 hypothetical protein [Lentisphaeria bacterium]
MFKNRNKIIIAVFIAWACLITFRLFNYTVYSRDHYLEEGNRHALRSGIIPAARGKILDRNGQVLAWTQRYNDLVVETYPGICLANTAVIKELQGKIKGLSPDKEKEKYIKRNLLPSEIYALKDYLSRYQGIRIVPRLERRYVDYPEVRKILGTVDSYEERDYGVVRIFGVSGTERKYDQHLKGMDGEYEVMQDRNRNWIPGTWKLKTEMRPGDDIRLESSLEEIISRDRKTDEGRKL